MPYRQALCIFPLIILCFPPFLVPPGSIYRKCTAKKSTLWFYASAQSDQSSSLTLCIVTKFGPTSTKTDQNARMHKPLSDLFTWRLSCEHKQKWNWKIMVKKTIMVPMTPSGSTKKTAAKTSISRSICTDSAKFLLPAGTMDDSLLVILCRCAGWSKFSVRRCHEVILACIWVQKCNQVYIQVSQ